MNEVLTFSLVNLLIYEEFYLHFFHYFISTFSVTYSCEVKCGSVQKPKRRRKTAKVGERRNTYKKL